MHPASQPGLPALAFGHSPWPVGELHDSQHTNRKTVCTCASRKPRWLRIVALHWPAQSSRRAITQPCGHAPVRRLLCLDYKHAFRDKNCQGRQALRQANHYCPMVACLVLRPLRSAFTSYVCSYFKVSPNAKDSLPEKLAQQAVDRTDVPTFPQSVFFSQMCFSLF